MSSIVQQPESPAGPGLGYALDHGLEVATLGADTLRAAVTVTGSLDASNVGLLTCVLGTHLGAGRRYLRVDLGGADLADDDADTSVVAALVAVHEAVIALGGMLAIENPGARTATAARAAALFVSTPG